MTDPTAQGDASAATGAAPIEARLANGQVLRFPAGTKTEVVQRTVKQMVANKGQRMTAGPGGRRMSGGPQDLPSIPFLDRSVLAAMDTPEEKQTFLFKKYGEQNVTQDKKGYVVNIGGKKFRADTGFASELVASAPETVLGVAGGMAGASGGIPGAVAGAFAGGAAGKAIKETVKAVEGLQKKTPTQLVGSVATAGAASGAGQAAGSALGLVRKIPLRSMMWDTTPETKAMTDKMLKGGARPPAQSTMPSARKFQRIAILADKISGPNKAIDRANFGYLQDRASELLNKAGVTGAAKDETMARLTQSEDAMSFMQTGRSIQQAARFMVKQVKGKDQAYLQQLIAKAKTPEDAYRWLVDPGQEDKLERFVRVMGKNSVVVQNVQQRALRQLLSGAMVRAESGEAEGALDAELAQFTKGQQRLLFPGGLDKDIKTLAKEIHFLYPKITDPAMAGFAAGGILQRPLLTSGGGSLLHGKSYGSIFHSRLAAQVTYSFMRALLQKPSMIRRLAIGLENTKTRIATKAAIKNMLNFAALEMMNPNQDPDQPAAQPQPVPEQQRGIVQR